MLTKNKSYKIAGGFFLFVSQMQLIEYLLWNHKVKCDDYNIKISNIGSILNHLQPLVLYILLTNLNSNISKENKKIMTISITIYLISLLLYSTKVYPLDCTTLDNKNHLFWKWNHKKNHTFFYIIFLSLLVLLSYLGFDKSYNTLFGIIIIVTYGLSYYKYKDTKAVGAIWCWYAALVPCFIMLYDLIKN
jgi:hypothetical protein